LSSNAARVSRTHYTTQLTPQLVGQTVRLGGWVEDARPLGSLVFLTVRDARGVAQAVFAKAELPAEVFERAQRVPRQSCVLVSGLIQASRAKGLAVEVRAHDLTVLNEAVHPLPIDPTGRVRSSVDLRLDSRALDLRNPRVAAVFRIRHTSLLSLRRSFVQQGFLEVNTSRLIGAAAEGGANLFALNYFGKAAYLAQSPQLYKEQLTLALDRVFEISGFFRAEKSATRKHLSEFTSIDMEMAFADEDDVMRLAERIFADLFRDVQAENAPELALLQHRLLMPQPPFPRITYARLVRELQARRVKIQLGEDLTDSLLRQAARQHRGFFWIVEWPLKLKPFYIARSATDPRISRGFDLQYGHLELASGGMRVSSGTELRQRLIENGLNPADFAPHLRAFDWGMPPHAGWAAGLDRTTMVLTGHANIRETILYPRDRLRLTP
jgi:aspartyl-tRNA synthetase